MHLVYLLLISCTSAIGISGLEQIADDQDHEKLHKVIRKDDLEQFLQLLRDKFNDDVNAANSTGMTMLHVASFFGSQRIVEDLLTTGELQLNPKNSNGETPLHLACLNGRVAMAKLLVEHAKLRNILADVVEAQDNSKKWTPIFYVARSTAPNDDIIQVVEELLGEGQANSEYHDTDGMQLLHVAVINRQLNVAKMLLQEKPPSACCANESAKTISHLAAEYSVVEFLNNLPEYFNATELDGQGQNAACWAAISGSVEFGQKMASEVWKIHVMDGKCVYGRKAKVIGTPLQVAAYHRRKEYVGFLLTQLGSTDQMVSQSGSGSLVHAMALKPGDDSVSDEDIVSIIQSRNVDVINSVDSDGRTPFMIAIQSSNIPFAKMLRRRGVRIYNILDKYGYSALHLAEDADAVDFLRTLPGEHYADLDLRSEPEQLTPLHVAVLEKKSAMFVSFLLNDYTNKSAVNRYDQSVAHLAVLANNSEALDIFLKQKPPFAAFSIRDREGRTPLLLAIELGRAEIARMMINNQHHFDMARLADDRMPGSEDAPIHLATRRIQTEIVEALLGRNGTMALLINSEDQTPLHLAVTEEKLVVAIAILQIISKDVKILSPLSSMTDNYGQTVVHLLPIGCDDGDIELAQRFFTPYFVQVENMTDTYGETPLEIAVNYYCVKIVQLFLENNMSCTVQNRHGYTPLHLAKQQRFGKLVNAMVATKRCSLEQTDACGISVRDEKARSATARRCESPPSIANGEVRRHAVSSKACPGTMLSFSCGDKYYLLGSPYIECTRHGKWLVQGYCILDTCCSSLVEVEKGLFNACVEGDIGRLRSLMACPCQFVSANVTYDDAKHGMSSGKASNGKSPLIFAAENGHLDIVEYLLKEAGSDINARGDNGRTALAEASMKGHGEVVKYLLAAGAKSTAAGL